MASPLKPSITVRLPASATNDLLTLGFSIRHVAARAGNSRLVSLQRWMFEMYAEPIQQEFYAGLTYVLTQACKARLAKKAIGYVLKSALE